MMITDNNTKLEEQEIKRFGKVGVFFGGKSAEREVSLRSGKAILDALVRSGVDAIAVDTGKLSAIEVIALKLDRAVIVLHGRDGEDGVVQGFLRTLDIPFTGSDVASSALAMNKVQSKRIWQALALPTAPFSIVKRQELMTEVGARRQFARLGPVLFVKPINEGSSVGMSKVKDPQQLIEAVELAHRYDEVAMIESFIGGDEYTVTILNDEALPSIRMQTPREFYDYEAKYLTNTTEYFCPSGLSDSDEDSLQKLALQAWQSLGLSGWGRIDFIRDDKDKRFILLEANTVPGMTETSLVPKAAKAAGIDFDELALKILETSFIGDQSNK